MQLATRLLLICVGLGVGGTASLACGKSTSPAPSQDVVTGVLVAHFDVYPTHVVADDAALYVSVGGNTNSYMGNIVGQIVRVPLDGGAARVLATGGNPAGIAVDSARVYWGDTKDLSLKSVAKTGGDVVTIVTNQDFPEELVVDDAYIYWTSSYDGNVVRMAKAGDAGIEVLASGQSGPIGIVVDPTNVYWVNGNFTDVDGGGSVARVPKDGGPLQVLAMGLLQPQALGADDAAVYWVRSWPMGATAHGEMTRFDKATGALTVLGSTGYADGIASDGEHVYWTDGNVWAVSVDGGAPVAFATGERMPLGLTIVKGNVYWVDFTSGDLRMAPALPSPSR